MTRLHVNPDGSGFAKSSFSYEPAGCVELRRDGDAVRDSKNVAGPVLSVTTDATAALLRFARR